MIAKLTGRLDSSTAGHAVIDVGGVGYLVEASARTLDALGPVGSDVTIHTEMLVGEDFLRLLGFAKAEERDWFRLLTSVQGVGAKVALAILSALEIGDLQRALASGDSAMIARANGVGPKLAQRIAHELKDKARRAGREYRGADRSSPPPPARSATPSPPSPASASSPAKRAPRWLLQTRNSAQAPASTRWCAPRSRRRPSERQGSQSILPLRPDPHRLHRRADPRVGLPLPRVQGTQRQCLAAQVRFPAEQVRIDGEAKAKMWQYTGDSGNTADFFFCGTCGSGVWYRARPIMTPMRCRSAISSPAMVSCRTIRSMKSAGSLGFRLSARQ